MSVIGSDGLSLLVGDNGSPETFNTLRGAQVTKFTIAQKLVDNDAVIYDAWKVGVAISERSATITCDGLMTDEAAPQRIRTLALNGTSGNFKLELDSAETLTFNAFVTNYRETIQPGAVKHFTCELQSNGAVTVAAG